MFGAERKKMMESTNQQRYSHVRCRHSADLAIELDQPVDPSTPGLTTAIQRYFRCILRVPHDKRAREPDT